MTSQHRVAELESRALPIPTRIEAITSAVKFFKANPDRTFRLYHGLEFMDKGHLRSLAVMGTPLEPVQAALEAAGVSTTGTVGGLLDSQVLTDEDVHVLACDCNVGVSRVDGQTASLMFQGRLQSG